LVAPERDVLNLLTNRDSPVFNERTLIYFRDVYDHLARLADTLDLYRDQLAGTMDANLSLASNELNRVMRTLTACSIIPELHWRFGYLWALGLIAGSEFGAVALLQAPQVVLSGSEGLGGRPWATRDYNCAMRSVPRTVLCSNSQHRRGAR
jgi:magnesium transporter